MWDQFSETYTKVDTTPQSFYLAIVNILHLQDADNILEVGAGGCLLLNYALEIKKREAYYFATDLSDKMLGIGRRRLSSTLEKYGT